MGKNIVSRRGLLSLQAGATGKGPLPQSRQQQKYQRKDDTN